MKRAWGLVLIVGLAALGTGPLRASMPQGTSSNVLDLTQQSSFIFSGTVQKVNAANPSTIPASESTAIVRVDEILRNAGVVSDVQNKNITVQLYRPSSVKEGEQAIFFTNVAMYAASIVVKEINHISSESKLAKDQVGDALRQLPDNELRARLDQADLVVTGRVSSVSVVDPQAERLPPSEHDPDWWQASVQVQSVEKGQTSGKSIAVYFPHSSDIRWFASPKFKVGQQGLFILRQTRDEKLKVSGFTALHPLDFQRVEQRQRIRALIQKR